MDNEIIENYFECNYKSHLKLNGIQGKKCNLEIFQHSEAKLSKIRYFTERLKISHQQEYGEHSLPEIIKLGEDYIFNVDVTFENFKLRCDFLKKVSSKANSNDFYYIPVLIVPTEHIARKSKVLISGIANELSQLQANPVAFAEVVYGQKFKLAKIKTESYLKEFQKIAVLLRDSNKFQFHLNPHCAICEFSKTCRKKAIEEDHLSLLKGITRERIKQLNNKGIFSIHQLSYTFRPKRKPGKVTHKKRTRSVELQALAIRERKIFIYDSPTLLPKARVEMFLDIEGLPEDNFYYLIGLTVKAENEIKHHHFWADTRTEQLGIVQQFFSHRTIL